MAGHGTLPLFVTVTARVRCSPRTALADAEREYSAAYVAVATFALTRNGTAPNELNHARPSRTRSNVSV